MTEQDEEVDKYYKEGATLFDEYTNLLRHKAMTLLQLNPSIPMLTPMGEGLAIMVADYSEEQDALWVVADTLTGQIWWWPNNKVRMSKNISLNRIAPEKP